MPFHNAPKGYRNKRATEKTLEALRGTGRLEPVDEATVGLARTLADAMDRVDPELYPAQMAALSRAYLATLRSLRGAHDDDGDGGLGDLLAALQAPLGDAPES